MSWREFRALLGPTGSWPLKGALAAVFTAALPVCYFLYSHLSEMRYQRSLRPRR